MFACYRPLGYVWCRTRLRWRGWVRPNVGGQAILTHGTGVAATRTHAAAAAPRSRSGAGRTRPLCSSLLESGLGLGFALFVSCTLRLVSFPNDPTTTGQ